MGAAERAESLVPRGRVVAAHVVSASGVALAITFAILGSSDADGAGPAIAFLLASLVTGGAAVAVSRRMLGESPVTPWLFVGTMPALIIGAVRLMG